MDTREYVARLFIEDEEGCSNPTIHFHVTEEDKTSFLQSSFKKIKESKPCYMNTYESIYYPKCPWLNINIAHMPETNPFNRPMWINHHVIWVSMEVKKWQEFADWADNGGSEKRWIQLDTGRKLDVIGEWLKTKK